MPDITLPQELVSRPNWICWRYELDSSGKKKKVPVNPQTNGYAQSNNPQTWHTFDYAKSHVNGNSGVGFVFDKGIIGIDLDNCVSGGIIESQCQGIIDSIDSYAEFSPSGNGVHIYCLGALPPGSRQKELAPGIKFEIYETGRFFTVTGNHVAGTPLEVLDRSTEIIELYTALFPAKQVASSKASAKPQGFKPSEQEILARAFQDEKFYRLWNGDLSEHGNDRSRADQALVDKLLFYFDDVNIVDRLFRQSSLMRDKWDEIHSSDGRTYGQLTIDKALGLVTDRYRPGASKKAAVDVGFKIGDYVNIVSQGVIQNELPWQILDLQTVPDGDVYALFAETKTGWPIEQLEHATLDYPTVIQIFKSLNNPSRKVLREKAFAFAYAIAEFSEIDFINFQNFIHDLGLPKTDLGDLRKIMKSLGKQIKLPQKANDSTPYAMKGGRLVYITERTNGYGDTVEIALPIADFVAVITEEITDEYNLRYFVIRGRALRGGDFTAEIRADDFADERKLKAVLESSAGALDPVMAGMAKHLGPAIKKLTPSVIQTRRFNHTGWQLDKFMLPGREASGQVVRLPRKLPYRISKEASLTPGLDALESLVACMNAEKTSICISFVFQAALAHLAGWRDERYTLFIRGRTGSLKTSFAQTAMCIYGAEFAQESSLLKWGEGATRNAIMAYATHAYDLPMLIDNYKPTTGAGSKDFVNLIHNILEGSEKDRLSRTSELRETRQVFCWPLVTGEDVPDNDAASLARLLVIEFDWQNGQANPELTKAQELSVHLNAVGESWLSWLESQNGKSAAQQAAIDFFRLRGEWADYLRRVRQDSVNILRVASNLASNQLTWTALLQHPAIGPVLAKHSDAYYIGLEKLARIMSETTAEALEATRFLEALRELLATGQVFLMDRHHSSVTASSQNVTASSPFAVGSYHNDVDRMIGWLEDDGSVYLLTKIARRKVDFLLTSSNILGISNRTLYTQIAALGLVQSTDKNQTEKTVRIGVKTHRVLHLRQEALSS